MRMVATGRQNGAGEIVQMQTKITKRSGRAAFTLVDTLVSIMIMGLVFATTIVAYTRTSERAEWSGYSLAAECLGVRQMERYHAVLWDTQTLPITDDTVNVPTNVVAPLDLPMTGTNAVWATNFTTMTTFTNAGPSYFKMIRVDTVWPWKGRLFTNTLVTYRCPDQ
jgi:type II secretory pathway pseudopilin PulG